MAPNPTTRIPMNCLQKPSKLKTRMGSSLTLLNATISGPVLILKAKIELFHPPIGAAVYRAIHSRAYTTVTHHHPKVPIGKDNKAVSIDL